MLFFTSTAVACEAIESPLNSLTATHVDYVPVEAEAGPPLDLGGPVSIAQVDANTLLVANYGQILLVDLRAGKFWPLRQPPDVQWVPTGLAYDVSTKQVFLANYTANDVLVMRLAADRKSLMLDRRIVNSMIRSPENVALSPDGKFFAVANYDGGTVQLFDRKTDALLWSAPLTHAHGVAFFGDSVVATGLALPGVVRYGLDGVVMAQQGASGWQANQYLWPTGVATEGQRIFISDAHSGKIHTLDSDLCELDTMGANGLGVGLFNMPYGILATNSGEWIADTFKARLLKVDVKSKQITAIVEAVRPPIIFGEGYGSNRTATRDPVDFLGHTLYPAYNGLRGDIALTLDGSAGLFSGGFYYWTQATQVKDAMVIGSAQTAQWLVVQRATVCPVSVGLNHWLGSSSLNSDRGEAIPLEELLSICSSRIAQLEAATDLAPMAAYREFVLPFKTEDFTKHFVSTEGISFIKHWCGLQTADDRRALARKFLEQKTTLVFLVEWALANVMAEHSGAALDHCPS